MLGTSSSRRLKAGIKIAYMGMSMGKGLQLQVTKSNGSLCDVQVEGYLLDLAVDELPGVGWNICQKLKEVNISSVRGIRASSKEALQRELGTKTGLPAVKLLRIVTVGIHVAYILTSSTGGTSKHCIIVCLSQDWYIYLFIFGLSMT